MSGECNWFIDHVFGQCVRTTREYFGFAIGMSSLGFWIACQMPQFIKNYRRKSGSGLSKCFLMEWFLGDAINLIGALLAHQLATQVATGVLFIMIDIIMISQMTYYSAIYPKLHPRSSIVESSQDADEYLYPRENHSIERHLLGNEQPRESRNSSPRSNSQTALSTLTAGSLAVVCVLSVVAMSSSPSSPTEVDMDLAMVAPSTGRQLMSLHLTPPNDVYHKLKVIDAAPAHVSASGNTHNVGWILGWVSAVVYLNSRVPQLLKNYKRKSVEGLSGVMFFCAVMGNTTYGLGVIFHDSSSSALMSALPWLIGSLGTLSLDFLILTQFWYYNPQRNAGRAEYEQLHSADELQNPFQSSPARGLYGIKSWTTSPFFKFARHPLRRGQDTPRERRRASHCATSQFDETVLDEVIHERADSV